MLEATTAETKAETTEAADLSETIVPATVAIGIAQSAATITSLSEQNATDAVRQKAAVADAQTTADAQMTADVPMTVDSKAVKIAVDALSETIVPTMVAIGIAPSATTITSLSEQNATDAVKQKAAVADARTTVDVPMTVDSKAVKIAVDALSETTIPTIVKMAIGTVQNATMITSLGEPNATSAVLQRLAEVREETIVVNEDRSKTEATDETTIEEATTEEDVAEARCTLTMIGSVQNATTQISHSVKNATGAGILAAAAAAAAADKAVHHDATTDEVAIHVEEIHEAAIHEAADKAVHRDAMTDEVAIHVEEIHVAATDSEAAANVVEIHEVATDEVAIHVEEIHEVATDEVAIHVEEIHVAATDSEAAANVVEIHEVATDEVAIHVEEIHEAATDEVAIHVEEIHEVAIHVEEIHEVATDEVAIHVEEIHEVAIHALLAVNRENSEKPAAKRPMVMLTTDHHVT